MGPGEDYEATCRLVKAMNFKSANQLYQMYKRHFGQTTQHTRRMQAFMVPAATSSPASCRS